MRLGFITILLILLGIAHSTIIVQGEEKSEPLIVVTFGYLKPDLERLICRGKVVSLIPEGIDPHEYQLRPGDIDTLRSANLIVSTGHTSFELRIIDMVETGEIKAELVDILRDIRGLKILVNPVTNQPNYHMPLNDPVNYLLFITFVADKLFTIDPDSRSCILEKYYQLTSEITYNVLPYRGKYNTGVLVDKPHAQYLADWLGFRVLWVLKPEEEYQLTPGDLDKVEMLLEKGYARLVIITEPGESPEATYLKALASNHDVPIIWVNSPSTMTGVYRALSNIIRQLERVELKESTPPVVSEEKRVFEPHLIIYPTLSFIIGVLIGVLIYRRMVKSSAK